MAKAPKFTLKPGQKTEIKIAAAKAVKKIKGLQKVVQKVNALEEFYIDLKTPKKNMSAALIKKIDALKISVSKELAKEKKTLAELKKLEDQLIYAEWQPTVKLILKDCSQAVQSFKQAKRVLLRGTSGPKAYMGRSWLTRNVKDSNKFGQQVFDYGLQKLGIKALRSNSIFCTSDWAQASSYGNSIYIIFPKNGFEYSWTKKNPDVVLDYDNMEDWLNLDYLNKLQNQVEKISKKKAEFHVIDEIYSGGLEDLIDSLKKIKYPNIDKINMENIVNLKGIVKAFAPANDDLALALKKGSEVLISGEYYALRLDEYNKILPMLGIPLVKYLDW